MSRKSGYYWICYADEWQIAYYNQYDMWFLTGYRENYSDSDFEQIDPIPIVREEVPQTEYDQKYLDWVKYNQKKS